MHRPTPQVALLAAMFPVLLVIAFDPGGHHPFGPAKWAVAALVGLGGLVGVRNVGTVPKRIKVTGLVLLGWTALTTALADDPLSAVVGTPDRRFGLVTIGVLFTLFTVGSAVEESALSVVLRGSAVASIAAGAISMTEMLGLPLVRLDISTDRLLGPFGTPTFTAGLVVMLLPLAIGSAEGEISLRWKVVGWIGALSPIAVLAGTRTLSGLAAVGATALVWVGTTLTSGRAGRQLMLATLGLCVVGATVLIAGQRLSGDPLDPLERRVDEWAVGTRAVAASPLVGYGLEGYRTVFGQVVDESYVAAYGRSTVTDRAHNAALDVSLWTGVPGGLLYLALLVLIGVQAVHALRSTGGHRQALGAAVLGYQLHLMATFPAWETDGLFWLLAGMLAVLDRPTRPLPQAVRRTAIAAGIVIASLGVLDVGADHDANVALEASSQGRYAEALDAAHRGTQFRPDSYRAQLVAAQVAFTAGDLRAAHQKISEARGLSPTDPALRLSEARLATQLALEGQVSTASARDLIGDALAADPLHPDLWEYARVLADLEGDTAAARHAQERIDELEH